MRTTFTLYPCSNAITRRLLASARYVGKRTAEKVSFVRHNSLFFLPFPSYLLHSRPPTPSSILALHPFPPYPLSLYPYPLHPRLLITFPSHYFTHISLLPPFPSLPYPPSPNVTPLLIPPPLPSFTPSLPIFLPHHPSHTHPPFPP